MPYHEAQERFDEALQIILTAWTSSERFSYDGAFWHYDDIIVEPPTAQQPHPPVWIAAGKPDSIRNVAARGHKLLLDQFASTEVIGERIAFFRAECETRGRAFDPLDIAVARNLHVARDAADAHAALERLAQSHARMVALSRPPDGGNASHITAYTGSPGATEASALYGTPDQIAAELDALSAVGVKRLLLHCTGPATDTMRRFAAEVMPAFTDPR
jgi:alkanesulfonate monooxygenase SsuD/methylene tetrahydromethanopterin reductase-like flavin-dependent oxidoreductase (luciferase family)